MINVPPPERMHAKLSHYKNCNSAFLFLSERSQWPFQVQQMKPLSCMDMPVSNANYATPMLHVDPCQYKRQLHNFSLHNTRVCVRSWRVSEMYLITPSCFAY